MVGNSGRAIGRRPGILHRAFDLGDDRLELVEKAVEAHRQTAQFVTAGVVQASGQVALATGDVFEPLGHREDRPGDAARHQTDQQQPHADRQHADQDRIQVVGRALLIQRLLQGLRPRQHHVTRRPNDHAPGLGRRYRLNRRHHTQLLACSQRRRRTAAQDPTDFTGLFRIGLVQRLAQPGGRAAVPGDQPGRADDADVTVAVIEVPVGGLDHALQRGQADVEADHPDHLIAVAQRQGDAGHQHRPPIDLIEVRIQQAGRRGCQRAGIPAVVGHAARPWRGVGEFVLGGHFGLELAVGDLRPVHRETPVQVAPGHVIVEELGILPVEAVRLEGHVNPEQLRTRLQRIAQPRRQRHAQGLGTDVALPELLAQHRDLLGKAARIGVVVHELGTYPLRLGLGERLHACVGRRFEHARAHVADHGGTLGRLVQRGGNEQRDDDQQAQAGQRGQLELDGKSGQHRTHPDGKDTAGLSACSRDSEGQPSGNASFWCILQRSSRRRIQSSSTVGSRSGRGSSA